MTPDLHSREASQPDARAHAARYAQRMILRPNGTGGLIMRALLTAPQSEFRPDTLVRHTSAPRNNVNTALNRLESLGLVSKRNDHQTPRLRGGGVVRWYRLTDKGRWAALREGLAPAPIGVVVGASVSKEIVS